MNLDLQNIEKEHSPYCPVCSGCGEDGCCSATVCKQSPEGHYCETYLKELKLSHSILNKISDKIFEEGNEEKYKELRNSFDYFFDIYWEKYFNKGNDLKESKNE
jgi:hypothetical protein